MVMVLAVVSMLLMFLRIHLCNHLPVNFSQLIIYPSTAFLDGCMWGIVSFCEIRFVFVLQTSALTHLGNVVGL